jgi:hypothetical protein
LDAKEFRMVGEIWKDLFEHHEELSKLYDLCMHGLLVFSG